MISSILLDSSINMADKDVRGIEADSSRQKPEAGHHDQGVAKVEERGN